MDEEKIPTCSNSALLALENVYYVFRYFFFAFTVQKSGNDKNLSTYLLANGGKCHF